MKMLVLRDPQTGKMACNYDAEGYPGWEVLEERDGPPPDHADWVDGKGYVVDDQRKAEVEEEARLRSMSHTERQVEAVNQAKQEIVDALLGANVITNTQARALSSPYLKS